MSAYPLNLVGIYKGKLGCPMAHFAFILNDDGSIAHILRDGALHQETVVLEQVHSVVTTYFKAANQNIVAMENITDREQLRFRGLQAFLMCLTGVEAFTNVFFHILGEERQLTELLRRAGRRQGPLIQRLTDCLSLAFHGPLEGQGQLMSRIGELYQLRNQIVHPRWSPASMVMVESDRIPLIIHGMTENFQAAFEDADFCRETYLWCMLLLARVAKAAGNSRVDGFCFHWGGHYGLTEESIMRGLGLNAAADRTG